MKQKSEVIRIGGLFDKDMSRQAGSVFDKKGISPTLDTSGGGYHMPLIVEVTNEKERV